MVDLNLTKGHEQSGRRPVLVLSVDLFNHGPAELVVVLPFTSQDKGIPFHVKVTAPEGGLERESFVKCEDIRSISRERLLRRMGTVSPQTIQAVEDRIRILLNL